MMKVLQGSGGDMLGALASKAAKMAVIVTLVANTGGRYLASGFAAYF